MNLPKFACFSNLISGTSFSAPPSLPSFLPLFPSAASCSVLMFLVFFSIYKIGFCSARATTIKIIGWFSMFQLNKGKWIYIVCKYFVWKSFSESNLHQNECSLK
jgi:hypothetical protein